MLPNKSPAAKDPVSLPHGWGLVALVALSEETLHRCRYLVSGGQILTGGFGVAVVLFLELAQQLAGGLITPGVGLDGHQVGLGGQVEFVGRQRESRHLHVAVEDRRGGLREGGVREVVGHVRRDPVGVDPSRPQMVFEVRGEGSRDLKTIDPAGVLLTERRIGGVRRVCGNAIGMP